VGVDDNNDIIPAQSANGKVEGITHRGEKESSLKYTDLPIDLNHSTGSQPIFMQFYNDL
jgi:hypothetical protein